MDKRCPRCRLINPADAARCDCGWVFAAGTLDATLAAAQAAGAAPKATWSWLCPAIAWASQIALALARVRLGTFGLVVMIVQGALLLAGLYLGGKVLALGRDILPSKTWWAAVIGVTLSAGTILLIVAMSLFSSI